MSDALLVGAITLMCIPTDPSPGKHPSSFCRLPESRQLLIALKNGDSILYAFVSRYPNSHRGFNATTMVLPSWKMTAMPVLTMPVKDVMMSSPTTFAHAFITSTPQVLHRNTNATTSSSICRHHPCPRPAFTPYPTHSPTPSASNASIPLAQLLPPRRRQRPGPLPAPRPVCTRLQTEPPWELEPLHNACDHSGSSCASGAVLVCFGALDSRRPDAVQVEIVIVWRGQRVTGKSTLILERIWASRACCSLLALLRRSTSHRVDTRIGEVGTRLLRRNGK